MRTPPDGSVVVATCRRPAQLLAAVASALAQDVNVELVVVDDSAEGSARAAITRLVHFLDDDDRVPPGTYRRMLDVFRAHPARGVVFGRVEPFGDDPTPSSKSANASTARTGARATRSASDRVTSWSRTSSSCIRFSSRPRA